MKRLAIFAVVFVFFLGSLVYLNVRIFDNNSQTVNDIAEKDSITATLKDPMADSDGDGLLNWEEDLYGSSKKNVDSDGDGVADGIEINIGTDPTVYGAHSREIEVISEETDIYEFSQTSNPSSIDDVMQNMELTGNLEISPGTTFVSLGTTESGPLRDCINQLGTVVQNASVTSINDVAILNNFLTNQTTNTYPITQMVNTYTNAAGQLQSIATGSCPTLATPTAQLSAAYTAQTVHLSTVLETQASTTPHYQAWVNHGQSMATWVEAFNKIADIARSSSLEFSPSEPGYVFIQTF